MSTLLSIRTTISTAIQNLTYLDSALDLLINDAITSIAGGIRMPNGMVSPPLPDLYSAATVSTATDAAYKTLGATYQRNVFMVSDDGGDQILPVNGGDYYSFGLFLKAIQEKDLSESGSIYKVCVKGSNLYYQGIPSASEDLTVHFYRLPIAIDSDDDEPDGIPSHLQLQLIKHYVCKDIFGDNINNDPSAPKKAVYHEIKFFKAMQDLIDFIGDTDSTPIYYHSDNSGFVDNGCCD